LPTELREAQQDFWLNAFAKDTLRAYQTQKRKWLEFCTRFQRSPQDLSPANLIDYLTYLATVAKDGAPLAYSTIRVYINFLGTSRSYTHPRLPNPVQHPQVQLFLRGVARRLGKAKHKAEPCTLVHLRAVNAMADQNPANRVLVTTSLVATLAFWGCLRLGALVPKRAEKVFRILRLCDVAVRGCSLVLTVRISKTIQFADRVHYVDVPAQADPRLCPIVAFNRWTTLLRPRTSQTPLCALSSDGTLISHGKFLDTVNGTRLAPLTGHSFRRGYVRLAFEKGVPIWQIMHHGDWKSLEVAMSYAEETLIPNPLTLGADRPP
jgi:hypothetical protein